MKTIPVFWGTLYSPANRVVGLLKVVGGGGDDGGERKEKKTYTKHRSWFLVAVCQASLNVLRWVLSNAKCEQASNDVKICDYKSRGGSPEHKDDGVCGSSSPPYADPTL